jgi:hypothetical protein
MLAFFVFWSPETPACKRNAGKFSYIDFKGAGTVATRSNLKRGTSTSSFGTTARIGHDSSKFYNSKLYSELAPSQVVDENDNEFPPELINKVILGSSEKMTDIPDRSLHLMITSPPYNVSKEYDENLSLERISWFVAECI